MAFKKRRYKMNRKSSRRNFSKNARVKSINNAVIFRGGVRL